MQVTYTMFFAEPVTFVATADPDDLIDEAIEDDNTFTATM